jgi:hypothetical protein
MLLKHFNIATIFNVTEVGIFWDRTLCFLLKWTNVSEEHAAFQRTMRPHIPEDTLHNLYCENLKSLTVTHALLFKKFLKAYEFQHFLN